MQHFTRMGKARFIRRKRKAPRDFQFQPEAEELCFPCMGDVDPGHECSGLRENLQQPFLLQLHHRIAHRRLADTILFGNPLP